MPSWFLFKFQSFSIPEFPQFTFPSLILFPLLDLEHFYSFPFSICVCVFLDFFTWFIHLYFFIFNLHTNPNSPSLPSSNYLHPLPWKNTGSHKESMKPRISSWCRAKTLCIKTEKDITPQNMAPLRALVVFKQTVSWWISISLYTFWNSYCCWYPTLPNGSQIRYMVLFFLYLLKFSLYPNIWLILEKFYQLLSWKYLGKIF